MEPHAHLDKAFSAVAFPNRQGTMAAAMAANLREHGERTAEQVAERAERALDRAWRNGLRAIRSHVDSLGPAAQPSWDALLEARQRWLGRVELQLVAMAPVDHWLSPDGVALARRVADGQGLLGGVIGPPYGQPHPGPLQAADRRQRAAPGGARKPAPQQPKIGHRQGHNGDLRLGQAVGQPVAGPR